MRWSRFVRNALFLVCWTFVNALPAQKAGAAAVAAPGTAAGDIDAAKLLESMRRSTELEQASTPSFRLSATFETFDPFGHSSGDGTLELLWKQPGSGGDAASARQTIVYRGKKEIVLRGETAGSWYEQGLERSLSEEGVIRSLLTPIPPERPDDVLSIVPSHYGGLSLRCVVDALPSATVKDSKHTTAEAAYCGSDDDKHVLRLIQGRPGRVTVYNSIVHLGGTYVPREITVSLAGRPLGKLHVTAFSAAPELGEKDFAEPTDAALQKGVREHHVGAKISSGVMAGKILNKESPIYPQDAKSKGISGTVVMRALIGKDGTIRDLDVMSGPDELAGAAMDAVWKWRYQPFLLEGQPTEVDTTITVNFSFGTR